MKAISLFIETCRAWRGREVELSLKDITLRYILTDKKRISYRKTTDFLRR